jgi:peptidoglycan hydrolase CwlO-like protein
MTSETTISVALIISLVSIACTLYNTFSGSKKSQKENMEQEIERRASMKEEFVKVNLKLDTFCRQLEELIRKLDKTDERLDDHEKRITNLESK